LSSSHAFPDLTSELLTLGAPGRRLAAVAAAVGVAGLGGAAALAAATAGGWRHALAAYLVNFVYFVSLALGALFFVLVQFATRAGWSVGVRRIAEGIAPNLFVPMAVLAVPVLLGVHVLYPWTDAARVAGDPRLQAKAAWLNVPFFVGRAVFYFTVWSVISTAFFRWSTRQDRTGDPRITNRMETASTAALILFAFTVTFFAFDFVMSLTPDWYSTIFGVYFFAGCVVSFFSLLAVAAFAIQGAGRLRHAITTEHYHDLGKLVFAFTVFWAYIGFSQYMLMWYANLPEETIWYQARQTGGWTAVSVLLLFGHFALPFVALMSRNVKRRKPLLVTGAVWVLVMHWVDVYWLVMPSQSEGIVPLSVMDVLMFAGIGGLFVAAAAHRLGGHALAPVKDPRLAESLGFENF
jgi:hypothetical protein